MKSLLGKKLRQLRLTAGLSFSALGSKTKIPPAHLRRLEKEEFEKLPDPVFVRGFLRKWAQATNGNADELQQMYTGVGLSSRSRGVFEFVPLRVIRVPSPKYIFIALCVACAVVLFGYIYYNQFIAVRDPQVQMIYPLDIVSVSLQNTIHIQGATQSVEQLTINGDAIPLMQDGVFSYHYSLEKGLNQISFVATNQNGKQVKIIRNVLYGN